MFQTLKNSVARDKDYPERQWNIDILTRVLEGKIYDVLPHSFQEEKGKNGEYVPLRDRRPSVRTGLCRVVVDDSVSLLFSEGHFPSPLTEDKGTQDGLEGLIKETLLNAVMIDAATRGSVGSVAILMRVLKARVFFKVFASTYLTPTWDPEAPDTLLKVREQYKVRGADLVKQGYQIEDEKAEYWFAREWDASAETWFQPWPVRLKKGEDPIKPVVDQGRTVEHKLGFVPMVWIKNLPGGDDIDGECTFEAAVDTTIEADYQLSQGGRGLKYASDPTLLIKTPGGNGAPAMHSGGAANALEISSEGDAKLLEINGTAAAAVIEYVRFLREIALESIHGNRSNADKISAAQSGRAMELMNQSLIWLADKLRISYGEGGLLALLRMVVLASKKVEIKVAGKTVKLSDEQPLSLQWPRWYAPTADDRLNDANTLATLTGSKVMSRESATAIAAETYDIEDVAAENARIQKEAEADADAQAALASVKGATIKPAP